MLVLEGHLCMAGDGFECSYLFVDGETLWGLLEPHGARVPNAKVERLPGSIDAIGGWGNHLQRDYGKVRITVEFLGEQASG